METMIFVHQLFIYCSVSWREEICPIFDSFDEEILDQRMKIDMSAIFDSNTNFVTANFSAGAGYPANALKYFRRYSFHNSKKIIRKSFVKATSNKNLR